MSPVDIAASVAGAVAFGWMAWVSSVLIEVKMAVKGTEARIAHLECENEEIWSVLDVLAPRRIVTDPQI